MVGEYGDRVAIGLDVRGHTLSARGWTRDGGDLFEVLVQELDREVEPSITVVIHSDLVEHVVVKLEEVRTACGLFQRDEVREDGD